MHMSKTQNAGDPVSLKRLFVVPLPWYWEKEKKKKTSSNTGV